jgi:hypothetical protein
MKTVQAITSSMPIKKKIVKAFRMKWDASKITNVKYNSIRNTYFATLFTYLPHQKEYQRLGVYEINAIEVEDN